MANWCSNSVVFAADDETLQNICNLFTDIERKQQVVRILRSLGKHQ